MSRRRISPGRLRRRLTVAFVAMAGTSAGALAVGSFLLVRQARLDDSLARARNEARFDLLLSSSQTFTGPGATPDAIRLFLRGYADRGVDVVLLSGRRRFATDPRLNPSIPPPLQRRVRAGTLAFQRITDGGRRLLVVGGRQPGSAAELYFPFSEDRLNRDLVQLRNVLALGWLAVMLVAGLIGRALAGRTLEPVARASQAARSMAEGLLDTRLPVEGRDEFGAWAASFNEMADALEEKIEALSEAQARERRFTSDVAHELRTPLTALVGEASLLRDHLDRMPEEARRPAELLIHDVARLRRLVDELMEISRLDSGRPSVEAERVDLTLLAAAVVRSRGWESRIDLRGQRVPVWTDRRRVERIVGNLVGNALEHGGAGVRVRVGKAGGGAAIVEVSDEGPGIPSEHLPHIFDRFYKADPSRTGGGSGLGLAIALENARLLGGDIEVRSEAGMGSRFRLLLPVTEPLPAGDGSVTEGPHAEVDIRREGGDR
jgi:two-component system, OmpR family, sensor histidine kinase MtrB